jgi:NhaP-type Na+/H+ or K+/H+ antiporter
MTQQILITISILVIVSYFFDIMSKWVRIPSVLFLLGSGLGIKLIWDNIGLPLYDVQPLLELFGTVGLILIVLEGSLDLELTKSKIPVIKKSLLSSTLPLLAGSVAIAYIIQYYFGGSFRIAWLNAIPIAVISSAVAIPSAANFEKSKKEFVVYESSFSDIIGIMIFNFALMEDAGSAFSIFKFGTDTLLIVAISIVCSILLFVFLHFVKLHIKFIFTFAILILVYALVKQLHLPSLLLVMFFGLLLNNYKLIQLEWIQKWLKEDKFDKELEQLKSITGESAFLIRTFFFLLFGFSLELNSIQNLSLWQSGLIIIAILFIFRFITLRLIDKKLLFPALFIAPKGLITVLLFYSIPADKRIFGFAEPSIFVIIIISLLLMMGGTLFTKKQTISNG